MEAQSETCYAAIGYIFSYRLWDPGRGSSPPPPHSHHHPRNPDDSPSSVLCVSRRPVHIPGAVCL